MRRSDNVAFERSRPKSIQEVSTESKIEYLVLRITNMLDNKFTGNIRFELNCSQGGVRTIKTTFEEMKKF